MALTPQFKKQVLAALLTARQNYDGPDTAFAKTWSIHPSIYSRLKGGETEGNLIKDAQWLTIGRELGVNLNERNWKVARTEVFNLIEDDIAFCQEHSKARICVDDCGIGKTFTARYLSRTRKNCFYIDASQSKTKQQFIRSMAKHIGVDNTGKYADVKANLKYYIGLLPLPIIIIDEAGDLDYAAFLELKELWNATENTCGWYLMGADGLQAKITKGIRAKKVGFRELFSRYSDRYTTIVPIDLQERKQFYKKLITDVLAANMTNKADLNKIVTRCLTTDEDGNISGLRRAESLLILNS